MKIVKDQSPAPFIAERRSFTDEQGQQIIEIDPIDGAVLPDNVARFIGTALVDTPRGPQTMHFPIKADTIAEAFKAFRESAEHHLREMQQQAPRIQVAQESDIRRIDGEVT